MKTEEEIFLENYNPDKYKKPSVTADNAIFTVRDGALCILLIKRGGHPFKGKWALPGGFLQEGETAEESAFRETSEETKTEPKILLPVKPLSRPGRDPRGWTVSLLYLSVLNMGAKAESGDDAADAAWFKVSLKKEGENEILTLKNGELEFCEVLRRKVKCGTAEYERIQSDLAFDHGEAIAFALSDLKKHIKDGNLIFEFLPEKFTLTELQRVCEAVIGKKLLTANFRRKVASYVEETDEFVTGMKCRPARLYKKRKGTKEDV